MGKGGCRGGTRRRGFGGGSGSGETDIVRTQPLSRLGFVWKSSEVLVDPRGVSLDLRQRIRPENTIPYKAEKTNPYWRADYEWPPIIIVSTCLMGQTGPASDFAGYGFHAGSVAGFYEITGWLDLPPDGPFTALTDVIAPRMLASTIVAAVDHRRRTGQGQFIDAAQIEMALQSLAPQIMDYNINGRVVTRNGNRSDNAAPHGAYPCSGEDQWCAIAVETEDQWRGFKTVLGDPDWVQDSRFDTVEGRLEHQDKLDQHVSSWSAGLKRQKR